MSGSTTSLPESETQQSEASQTSTEQPSESDPIGNTTFPEKYKANLLNLGLAHRGMMLEKVMRQNRIVETTVKGIQDGLGGTGADGDEDEDDGMGVSVGNEIHYHIEQAAPQQPAPAPTPPVVTPDPVPPPTPVSPAPNPPTVIQTSTPNRWLPWALASLLGAGGVAAGWGMSQMGSGGHTVDTDTDTRTETITGFGEPRYMESEG